MSEENYWNVTMTCLLRIIFILTLSLIAPLTATAETQKHVILTVTGDVEGGMIEYDRSALKNIGWRKITTENPFLEGPQTFEGIPLSDFLAHLGVTTGTITATALDGYSVDIPVQDAFERNVLMALDHQGKKMRIRNRGPIWIIYPMTHDETLRGDTDGRMIWQLIKMNITR